MPRQSAFKNNPALASRAGKVSSKKGKQNRRTVYNRLLNMAATEEDIELGKQVITDALSGKYGDSSKLDIAKAMLDASYRQQDAIHKKELDIEKKQAFLDLERKAKKYDLALNKLIMSMSDSALNLYLAEKDKELAE